MQPLSEKGGRGAGRAFPPDCSLDVAVAHVLCFLNGSRVERITAAGWAPCAPSSSLLLALTLALHLRLISPQSCVLDVVNVVQRLYYKSSLNDPPQSGQGSL